MILIQFKNIIYKNKLSLYVIITTAKFFIVQALKKMLLGFFSSSNSHFGRDKLKCFARVSTFILVQCLCIRLGAYSYGVQQ